MSDKFYGDKWESIPMPTGRSDEVYALVSEKLSDEEKNVLADYTEWYRKIYYKGKR